MIDYIVIAIIVACLTGIGWSYIKRKKSGKGAACSCGSSCSSSGCSGCSHSSHVTK